MVRRYDEGMEPGQAPEKAPTVAASVTGAGSAHLLCQRSATIKCGRLIEGWRWLLHPGSSSWWSGGKPGAVSVYRVGREPGVPTWSWSLAECEHALMRTTIEDEQAGIVCSEHEHEVVEAAVWWRGCQHSEVADVMSTLAEATDRFGEVIRLDQGHRHNYRPRVRRRDVVELARSRRLCAAAYFLGQVNLIQP